MNIRFVVGQHKAVTILVLFLILTSARLYAAQICDINEDNVVLQDDIDLIFQAKNQPANAPFDPRDIDRNGIINTDDARQCVCFLPTTSDCEPPLNQSPVVNAGADQRLTQAVFSVVNLTGEVSDPDTDPVSFSWTFQEVPAGSQAVLADSNTLTPSFTPDQFGRYILILTATDAFDASSSSTVNIDIDSPPSTLQANADTISVDSGSSVTGNLLDNDIQGIGTTSVDSISQNAQTISPGSQLTTSAGGLLTVQTNGSFSYNSPANIESEIQETFTYNISDQSNANSSANLVVTVNPVEPPPPPPPVLQANPDSNSTVVNGTTVSGNVLSNDQFQGERPSVSELPRSTQPRGIFSLSTNGNYSYTPPTAARTSFVEQFRYQITDQSGQFDTAVITIQVEVVVLPLTARDDVAAAIAAGSAISGNVTTNDSLGNQPSRVAPLRTNLRTEIGGLFTLQSNGGFTYMPPETLETTRTETFDYDLIDLNGQQDSATLLITVNPENRDPMANPDLATAEAGGGAVSGNVLNNDDAGNEPTVVSPVRLNVSTDRGGVLTLQANGAFSYLPPLAIDSGSLEEVFVYSITDNDGQTDSSTLTFTINQGNQFPDAVPDQDSAEIGGPEIFGNVLANDDLGDQPIQFTGVQTDLTTEQGGLFNLDSNGNYTYQPPLEINGSGRVFDEQFNYTITDSNGDSDSTMLTIMVSEQDIRPLAVPDAFTAVAGGVAIMANVLDNDNRGNEPTLVAPSNQIDAEFGDSFNLIATGEFSYMPPPTVDGVETRVFDYSITDVDGDTSPSTVTITVNPQPAVLVCNDDQFTVTAGDDPLEGNVLTNDLTNNVPVQVRLQSVSNSLGLLNLQANGDFIYSPPGSVPNVSRDEFIYIVTNANNPDDTCNATVTITINQENLIPQAVSDRVSVTAGETVMGNVLSNDNQGNPVAVVTMQDINPTQLGGSLTLNEDGTFVYTAPTSVQGIERDFFTYVLTDGNQDSDTATLSITVNPVNIRPFAVPDFAEVFARPNSSGVQGNVLLNDNPGNEPTLVTTTIDNERTAYGVMNLDGQGNYSFLPISSVNGVVREIFNYTIRDNDGQTAASTLTVTINPTCQAQDDTVMIKAGGNFIETSVDGFFSPNTVEGNVLANDLFCESQSTVSEQQTLATENLGSLTLMADGQFVYQAPSAELVDSVQQDRFRYLVTDSRGDTSTADIVVNVYPELRANTDNSTGSYLIPLNSFSAPRITGNVLANDSKGIEPTTAQPMSETVRGCQFSLSENGEYTYTLSSTEFVSTLQGLQIRRVPCFEFSNNIVETRQGNELVKEQTFSIIYTIVDSTGESSIGVILLTVRQRRVDPIVIVTDVSSAAFPQQPTGPGFPPVP